MVDTTDLKSVTARCTGSSPVWGMEDTWQLRLNTFNQMQKNL